MAVYPLVFMLPFESIKKNFWPLAAFPFKNPPPYLPPNSQKNKLKIPLFFFGHFLNFFFSTFSPQRFLGFLPQISPLGTVKPPNWKSGEKIFRQKKKKEKVVFGKKGDFRGGEKFPQMVHWKNPGKNQNKTFWGPPQEKNFFVKKEIPVITVKCTL